MGIFSFVGGITSTIGKVVERAVVLPVGNTISNIIKPGSGKATVESFNATTVGKVLTNAIGGAVVALPIAAIGVGTVAKAAVTNPIKTTAVVVTGSVLSSSAKAQNVVASQVVAAPSNLNQFGSNIGKAIENPSISTVTNIAKENPLLTTAVAAAAAYAGAKVILPAAAIESTRANTKVMKENAKAVTIPEVPKADYSQQIAVIDAQTKSQLSIIEAQKELITTSYSPVVSSGSSTGVLPVPVSTGTTAAKKKKKKKKTVKKKKKTVKKKKKTVKKKKKKKTIKRKKRKK